MLPEDQTLSWGGIQRMYQLRETDYAAGRPPGVLLHGGGATIDALVGAIGGAAGLLPRGALTASSVSRIAQRVDTDAGCQLHE